MFNIMSFYNMPFMINCKDFIVNTASELYDMYDRFVMFDCICYYRY